MRDGLVNESPASQEARAVARARRGRATHGVVAQGPAALLFATAPAGDGGGPAAALAWEGGTLLSRLLAQLATLGIRSARLVTRPGWEDALRPSLDGAPVVVEVLASPGTAQDLRTAARLVREADGDLVVAQADVLTQREALAGLLADPRIRTGILATGGGLGRPFAPRVRTRRGRVVAAGSPYHAVHQSTASFLGVIRVADDDRALLAGQAERMAQLVDDPPEAWDEELGAKAVRWRMSLAQTLLHRQAEEAALAAGQPPPPRGPQLDPDTLLAVELPSETLVEIDHRRAAAPDDAASLLLVGLVRGGAHVSNSYLRELFWERPLSHDVLRRARERIVEYDEDRVLLDSAVKATDGFFTTFFVSPYSKYIARWAARRGLTPNQVTTFSLAVGVAAGAAFATGQRWGLIAGAVLLQAAFTFDCVDGQLARYSRQFSKLGAWLDSVFDRAKEYVVFAGLAIGASRAGDPVWVLAGSALTLQTVRHMFDFSFAATQHQAIGATTHPPLSQPGDGTGPATARWIELAGTVAAAQRRRQTLAREPGERLVPWLSRALLVLWRRFDQWRAVPWLKRMVVFPIGERFAAISITAAIWTPRVTFVVLLAWGAVAAAYGMAGRLLRTFAR